MNNLLSYCGLVVAKIRASDKDLPVKVTLSQRVLHFYSNLHKKVPNHFPEYFLVVGKFYESDLAPFFLEIGVKGKSFLKLSYPLVKNSLLHLIYKII